MKVYQIKESTTRGKIVVAVRDIMPGELVVEEKEPVLYFTHAFYSQFDAGDTGLDKVLPAFSVFSKQLTSEKQQKLLSLFGPTTGQTAESIRNYARKNMKYRFREDEEPRSMNSEELELFVKVAQVLRLNIFGSEEFGYAVFEEITRLAHSCDANCHYAYDGVSITCHANRFVKAGEELTISYVSARDLQPTHERRFRYLERKEFTCHCRRCDAPGDDTRQFDCVDPACTGVMMACEPIDKREIVVTNASYSDVEYQEPHLLPCTVCHRTPSADYQAKMFELEAQLPSLVEKMSQRYSALHVVRHAKEFEALLRELLSHKFPRRHAAVLPLLKLEWRIKYKMFHNKFCSAASVHASLSGHIAAMENILRYPHSELLKEMKFAVEITTNARLRSVLSPKEEKDLCQKALRMHLLIHGRNRREEALLDNPLSRALQKLPPTGLTDVCAFCEESPQRAALTLSRCGRCKQVAYCSPGCQKAH